MLNPSKADAHHNDPTIRRCIDFATQWRGTHLLVVNLFALCATTPTTLWQDGVHDVVGPKNDETILAAAELTQHHKGIMIAAWGNHGGLKQRERDVLRTIAFCHPKCLKVNKTGSPAHPLYQPKKARPVKLAFNR